MLTRKATLDPDEKYSNSTHHNLVTDGCGADSTVQFHSAESSSVQRFSFEVFQFSEETTAVLFIHCNVEVCSVSTKFYFPLIDYSSWDFFALGGTRGTAELSYYCLN